jgi:hypothetical protein
MMIRLYQGKTTKKRALVVGILSELQMVVIYYGMGLIVMLFSPGFDPFFQIFVPIPLLLFVGLIIVQLYPPEEQTMWIEEEQSRSWWESEDDKSTSTTEPPKDKSKKSKEPESPW